MQTLLVAVDFSKSTRAVVETAVGLVSSSEGARILLHHCHNPPVVTPEYGLGLEMVNEVASLSEKTARRQLDHLAKELVSRGFDAEAVLETGVPARRILDLASKRRVNLIVLGSHGHTALFELLLGGTTHAVLKKARCPVLVVPAACPAPRRRKAAA